MKKYNYILAIFVLGLISFGVSGTSAALPTDLNVQLYTGLTTNKDSHSEATALKANLTAAGSKFLKQDENDTFAVSADVNVLLLPNADLVWSEASIKVVKDWFNGDGKKLLWVTGDSDYGGDFLANNTNVLLEGLGAASRIAAVSVADTQSNDGRDYRVMSNESLSDGKLNGKFNEGVKTMVLHGPTAVCALVDDEVVDPLKTEVKKYEVIRKSSAAATVSDADLSDTDYDLYGDYTGDIPMIAIEQMDKGKWIMTSGEAVFSDYKVMYSTVTEGGQKTDGKTFTDNVLSWFSESGDSDSLASFLPIPVFPIFASFAVIVLIKKRK